MRRDSRKVLAIGLLFLTGVGGGAARQDGKTAGPGTAPESVRLTIELSWAISGAKAASDGGQGPGPGLGLELSEGRVVEAVSWPPSDGNPPGWGPAEREGWRLGVGTEGRVRARIEAPVDAKLIVRGGDQVVSVPLAAVLERPQRTPSPAPLTVSVERLAWDTLSVDLGASASGGIAAPGVEVPVSVGFNILWPEATDVTVRYSAVLRPARGGEVISRRDGQEVLPTNRLAAPVHILGLRAPLAEGAYTIEVQASWEPVVREGSRLGRLIRRRKPAVAAASSVRRVALTVLGPAAPQPAEGGAATTRDGRRGEVEVDSVDLLRPRIHRFLTAGRSPIAEDGRSAWDVPAPALIEPSRRDRLRGGFLRPGPEAERLDPADGSGLSWSAVGLKATHPDRPHRLTLTVRGGEPSAMGVGLIEARDARPDGPRPRVLLDACASGPPILEDGPPVSFSWLVWPGSAETVLVVFNRSPDTAVRLGTVALTELEDLPGPPPIHEPTTTATRALGLYLEGAHPLDPFGGDSGPGDTWAAATNLARYLAYCGATAVVAPESLADRPDRRALDGQAEEDTAGPDRLDVLRRVLERQGCSLWLELSFDGHGVLPGLPPPDSDEAVRRGLVRLDGRGRAADSAYHPLHPEVRRAMRRRVVEALKRARHGRAADPRTAPGLVIRLGPGPTLLGTPDTGVDDATYAQFVRETFSPETARSVRGRGTEDPERFAVRLDYLAGAGRMPWLTWRSRAMASLYTELNAAAQEAVPGAVMAVVTPGLDGGPAGAEARRVDLAGLTPGQAWRSVGLDLASWPGGPTGPAVLRGVALSSDALAHDLATSPDLDAIVAGRPRRGLLLTIDGSSPAPAARAPTPSAAPMAPRGPSIRLSALPLGDGPSADEPLGHALAALDAHWVFLAAGAAAGHEERLRRFAGTLRALPAWSSSTPDPSADPRALPFGTAVRSSSDATQSFLAIANDSPYPIRLACLLEAPETAAVEDLSRGFRLSPTAEAGGRNLVLDLLPFGVSAIRIAAPGTRVASLTAYPSEAVLAGMQARSRELALQLARLNQGLTDGATEPANPGFEPAPESGRPPSPSPAAEASPTGEPLPPLPGAADPGVATAGGAGPIAGDRPAVPGGWRVESGDPGATQPARGVAKARAAATIAIDPSHPHTGRGSLRLSATDAPASVVSAPFAPNPQSSLTIQAYLRTEPPGAAVRVWIEGESAGRPYVRRSELTVSSAWEARAVRASDLPPGGLDSARVRFEMLAPGVLWIDDLRVGGDAASRSARLNAQRTMLAALQAYRERRYADFARLAASHWVRESAVAAARMARSGEPRPAPGARPADTEASALSRDRTLR